MNARGGLQSKAPLLLAILGGTILLCGVVLLVIGLVQFAVDSSDYALRPAKESREEFEARLEAQTPKAPPLPTMLVQVARF